MTDLVKTINTICKEYCEGTGPMIDSPLGLKLKSILEKHLNHTTPCEHKESIRCPRCGIWIGNPYEADELVNGIEEPKVEASKQEKIEKLSKSNDTYRDEIVQNKLNEVIERINKQYKKN